MNSEEIEARLLAAEAKLQKLEDIEAISRRASISSEFIFFSLDDFYYFSIF